MPALKQAVRAYWETQACGADAATSPKFTRDYFDEIERHRYAQEPFIPPFADFPSARGRRVLEVGVGAATDFLQWVRAGAEAYGVDLTQEAVDHARQRLAVYGLAAADLRRADAEALPYPDGMFDLVYSWGVVHHTPDPPRALQEIVRACRPGGSIKLMLYNRHSLAAYRVWMRQALLRGRPWRSLAWCVSHHVESPGTRAYTVAEVRALLGCLPLEDVRTATLLTHSDLLPHRGPLVRGLARGAAALLGGRRSGWFITVQARKT